MYMDSTEISSLVHSVASIICDTYYKLGKGTLYGVARMDGVGTVQSYSMHHSLIGFTCEGRPARLITP